jgi:phenylpropionate dioxygenase-like ring-hydroxylating dioxygenase large terminal subunit
MPMIAPAPGEPVAAGVRRQPEPLLWDDWHAIAECEMLRRSGSHATELFGLPIAVTSFADGSVAAAITGDEARALPVRIKYGLVWTCLGEAQREIVDFPESAETDRYVNPVGSLGIAVSGLRLVENFLDIGHFPFVHTGYLGSEPYTEVFPYTVKVTDDDEIWISDCRFEQPQSSAVAGESAEVKYIFRVLRPYTVVLHKSNALDPARWDTIAMAVQPVDEERCVAHIVSLTLRTGDPDETYRWFQRLITSQDKPILENQRPKRLPLDPRAELPVRADIGGTAYRRWLSEHGITYGAIPIAQSRSTAGSDA